MKRVHLFAILTLLLIKIVGCANAPVDPISPIIPSGNDTLNKKNGVKLSVEISPRGSTIMVGESIMLSSKATVTKDTNLVKTDSTVKNYKLTDSTVTWSIESGVGSITYNGMYYAPASITGTEAHVVVKAVLNADLTVVDRTTITITKPNLYPLILGSNWVYDVYPIDTLTGQRITARKSTDSSAIVGNVYQDGKLTSMMINYRNGIALDTNYFYINNTDVYVYTRVQDLVATTNIKRQWIKLIDNNNNNWVAFDTTLSNAPVTINGQSGVISGRLTIQCAKGKTDSVDIAKGKVNAQRFTYTYSVNMIITVNNINIPVQYTIPTDEWFADNVGSVRSMKGLYQVFSMFGGLLKKSEEERVLVSYSKPMN
ncbi:MAG: hypothetical protein U0Y96_00015 [Candidatus Kapaibacterium sp.]